MSETAFPDRARVAARDMVRGATLYSADVPLPRMTHAMTVPSAIARGRVTAIETGPARVLPSVLAVLTHADFAGVTSAGYVLGGGYGTHSHQPMLSDRIAYRGEPVALVVAETLETAVEAAGLVRLRYDTEPFAATPDSPDAEVTAPRDTVKIGDAEAALAAAAFRVEGSFHCPSAHHNPMELISTTADWQDGRLTIHEGTQNSGAIKHGLAAALGLDPSRIRVNSAFTGGGFGQKNSMQPQTVLAARASMMLNRPVKLVLPRAQIFFTAPLRPASRHTVRLGADAQGRIVAATLQSRQQNNRADTLNANFATVPARLYDIANFSASEQLVRCDTACVGYMRSPFDHEAVFAFESAVDELAHVAGQDPLAFRLANDAARDPVTGKPFSSRFLVECLRDGARRFGWDRRSPEPGSMRGPDGTLIGLGVATGAYKAASSPATARLRVSANGTTRIAVSGHEMGQGIRTAILNALVERLAVDPERVEILIGDPDAAPQHLTAGSWGTASTIPAVCAAADLLQQRYDELRNGRTLTGTLHQGLASLKRPSIEVEASSRAPGQPDAVFGRLAGGLPAPAGPEHPNFLSFSYAAHFVEVHVEPTTRRIRVPRVVSIIDCGRVVSPRTAESQVRGGVVWGLGASLREAGETDPRFGGALNNDLAEYVVPVNADIGRIEVGFINRPDPLLNATGVKGIGEVVMVGVAAAIGNAVFHATGRRLRELPMRAEHLL
ncbi:xanthine dehydrogenase family protein molybdopterin-binding subunit [Pseudoroseomonas globiformis]|uniref:Xanthine dehydrogenase family protein molybdopterin-binding subunit n=1 Tax=Teichococcus globiformis TaxID=2307229 RepID=A0ABV7G064_9PROT